jgi:UDP-GlcNAc:undecaprenyl-phosphate GlcNAc-1-phosphate transferase
MTLLPLGVFFGAACTFLVRRFALKHGIVNHPNPIVPQHTRPVAYLGGAGIFIALVLAFPAAGITIPLRIILGAFCAMLIGLIDDLRPMSPILKLGLQLAVALTAVLFGLVPQVFDGALLNTALAVSGIVLLFNAFNLTDVSDGLVSLLMIISCVGLALIGADGSLALGTTAVILGFLLFNKPDASIFLGDAGSHLLGFLAAVLIFDPVFGSLGSRPGALLLIGSLLCVGVPLFELLFLIIVRAGKGIPWYRGSPDHFALRLQKHGFSKLGVLLVAAFAAALLCMAGLLLKVVSVAIGYALLLIVAAAAVVAGITLGKMECDVPSSGTP